MAAPLSTLHYVQLQCPAKLYPSETSALLSASTPQWHSMSAPLPGVIADEDEVTFYAVPVTDAGQAGPSGHSLTSPSGSPSTIPCVSPTTMPPFDLGGISGRLDSLTCLVKHLLPFDLTGPSVINDGTNGPLGP